MAEYFDCVISAGYYNLFGGPVGEHTFAIAEKNGVRYAFPCFGGFALAEGERGQSGVRYPAELWSPYMIFSTPQGKSLPANLYVALGMAQFSLAPASNYRIADWDEWWGQHPELSGFSPSCYAGIVYAVSGVCQQACNRILWASRKDSFTYTPVNWPPSFSASYWVYGYYGKITELIAIGFANELVQRAPYASLGGEVYGNVSFGIESTAASVSAETGKRLAQASLRQTRKALQAKPPVRARRQEVKTILDAAPGGKGVAESKKLSGLLAPDRKFQEMKAELDKQLLRGEVSHDEYASRVNAEFNHMLEEFRNILPPDTFQAIFREAAGGKEVEIIQRKQMPESYAPFQETMRI